MKLMQFGRRVFDVDRIYAVAIDPAHDMNGKKLFDIRVRLALPSEVITYDLSGHEADLFMAWLRENSIDYRGRGGYTGQTVRLDEGHEATLGR
jgi:hypothetical protein